jgi:hypothetical protein
MKIYISGQITGLQENEVIEKFGKAEQELSEQGYEVVNPLKTTIPYNAPWKTHIAIDIILLLGCDAIYLLPDWIYSKGATLEKKIAEQAGKEIICRQEPELIQLKEAIENVTGVSFYIISESKRDRINVYARMLYAHFARLDGLTVEKIAGEMKKNHSTIIYYLRKFEDENRFNHEFNGIVKRVTQMLHETEHDI